MSGTPPMVLPNHHDLLHHNFTSIHLSNNYNNNVNNNVNVDAASQTSSVDYMACCGAGHRISKMADAYYLAQRLNFTLRAYWGYCDTVATTGQYTEVFQYVEICVYI